MYYACPGQGCLSVTPTGVLAHIIPQVSSAPKEQPENAMWHNCKALLQMC